MLLVLIFVSELKAEPQMWRHRQVSQVLPLFHGSRSHRCWQTAETFGASTKRCTKRELFFQMICRLKNWPSLLGAHTPRTPNGCTWSLRLARKSALAVEAEQANIRILNENWPGAFRPISMREKDVIMNCSGWSEDDSLSELTATGWAPAICGTLPQVQWTCAPCCWSCPIAFRECRNVHDTGRFRQPSLSVSAPPEYEKCRAFAISVRARHTRDGRAVITRKHMRRLRM